MIFPQNICFSFQKAFSFVGICCSCRTLQIYLKDLTTLENGIIFGKMFPEELWYKPVQISTNSINPSIFFRKIFHLVWIAYLKKKNLFWLKNLSWLLPWLRKFQMSQEFFVTFCYRIYKTISFTKIHLMWFIFMQHP